VPQGTSFRKNGTWFIERPNFSKKDGRRVFWTSRIEIEFDAGSITKIADSSKTGYLQELSLPAFPALKVEQTELTTLNAIKYANIYAPPPVTTGSKLGESRHP